MKVIQNLFNTINELSCSILFKSYIFSKKRQILKYKRKKVFLFSFFLIEKLVFAL